MRKASSITAEALLRMAKKAESHESFTVVRGGRSYRIGVGVREQHSGRYAFFIEAIVSLTPQSPKVDLQQLESKLRILKRLTTMGYALEYQDDFSIVCEAEFSGDDIASKCESLEAVLVTMPRVTLAPLQALTRRHRGGD